MLSSLAHKFHSTNILLFRPRRASYCQPLLTQHKGSSAHIGLSLHHPGMLVLYKLPECLSDSCLRSTCKLIGAVLEALSFTGEGAIFY